MGVAPLHDGFVDLALVGLGWQKGGAVFEVYVDLEFVVGAYLCYAFVVQGYATFVGFGQSCECLYGVFGKHACVCVGVSVRWSGRGRGLR